jgi:hypothetical protein
VFRRTKKTGHANGFGEFAVSIIYIFYPMVSLKFFIDIVLLDALWPSNRNEYQKYFLGV